MITVCRNKHLYENRAGERLVLWLCFAIRLPLYLEVFAQLFLRLNRWLFLLNDNGAQLITDTVTALYRYHEAAKSFFDHPEPGQEETDIIPGN